MLNLKDVCGIATKLKLVEREHLIGVAIAGLFLAACGPATPLPPPPTDTAQPTNFIVSIIEPTQPATMTVVPSETNTATATFVPSTATSTATGTPTETVESPATPEAEAGFAWETLTNPETNQPFPSVVTEYLGKKATDAPNWDMFFDDSRAERTGSGWLTSLLVDNQLVNSEYSLGVIDGISLNVIYSTQVSYYDGNGEQVIANAPLVCELGGQFYFCAFAHNFKNVPALAGQQITQELVLKWLETTIENGESLAEVIYEPGAVMPILIPKANSIDAIAKGAQDPIAAKKIAKYLNQFIGQHLNEYNSLFNSGIPITVIDKNGDSLPILISWDLPTDSSAKGSRYNLTPTANPTSGDQE